jgi:hypothetical protein
MADEVFINGMAAIHAGSAAKGIAFPDVCLCPPSPSAGPIPTPLPNNFKASDLTAGAATVTIEGNRVGNLSSYIAKSTGNAVSRPTGGGVITHAVEGAAYPVMGSPNVFIEGHPALRANDLWTANHMPGVRMPPNTPPAPLLGPMIPPAVAPKTVTKDLSKGKKGQKSWVRFVIQDEAKRAALWIKYSAKLPDGQTLDGLAPAGSAVELRGLPKGSVQLTLVDYDASCFEGAKAGEERGGRVHVARQGETGAKIAWKHGFADVSVIWQHPDNRELAKARTNPNVLRPGDKLTIPPHKVAVFKLAAEQETTIRARLPTQRLHLKIELEIGEPASSARYELTFREDRKLRRRTGTTDGAGVLDEEVPFRAKQLHLRLWPKDSKGKNDCLRLELGLGHLDPVEDLAGVQARLENLGFHCGEEDGELGPCTQVALRRFRAEHKIEEEDLMGPATLKRLQQEQKA